MENDGSTDDLETLAEWHAKRADVKRGVAAVWQRRGESALGSYYEQSAERHASTARLLRSMRREAPA